jgi:hypothetical protein
VAYADSQYGNAASATLSLCLLSVTTSQFLLMLPFYQCLLTAPTSWQTVKNKAAGELAIKSVMQQITDQLPDLEIYQRAYADGAFGRLLADVYVNVICFSIP